MPGPQPPNVPLSEAERQELLTLIRAHKTPQHFSFRAHIILLLAAGPGPERPSGNTPLGHEPPHGPALATALAGAPTLCGSRALTRYPTTGHAADLQRRGVFV